MQRTHKRASNDQVINGSSVKKNVMEMIDTMVNNYRQSLLKEISNLSSPVKTKANKLPKNNSELIPSSSIARDLKITAQGMAYRCKSKKVIRVKKNKRWFIKKSDIEKLKS